VKGIATDVRDLADQIKALSPPEKLRLAADLLDAKRGDVAHSIIQSVATELGAALALRMVEPRATVTGSATHE
jgi:hypothetical protein